MCYINMVEIFRLRSKMLKQGKRRSILFVNVHIYLGNYRMKLTKKSKKSKIYKKVSKKGGWKEEEKLLY